MGDLHVADGLARYVRMPDSLLDDAHTPLQCQRLAAAPSPSECIHTLGG